MTILSNMLEAIFPDILSKFPAMKKTYTTANPPDKDSALERLTVPFLIMLTTMSTIYGVVFWLGRDAILFGLHPAPQICLDSSSACHRRDLFAYQVTTGLSFVVMGGYSFYTWHIQGLHRNVPQTPAGRCLSYIPEAEFLGLVCFTFQVWNFLISLTIPEHCTPIMMTHHAVTAAASFYAMYAQYLHWYGFFYFGLSEVSSIFLVLVDPAKVMPPPSEDSPLASFIAMYSPPMFAITFLFYRGIMWWYITYLQFTDSYSILTSGQAQKLRPGKTWVLLFLSLCNIPMGILQLYWCGLILAEIKQMLSKGA